MNDNVNESKTQSEGRNQAAATSIEVTLNREKINLDSHQLVWLDSKVHDHEYQHTTVNLKGLRKIIDYTKLFDSVQDCKEYLERTDNGLTYLVTSGSLGQIFIPQVHDIKSVFRIYVYCQNKEYHQQWASNHSKIKERVYTELDELLNALKYDVAEQLEIERTGVSINKTGRTDQTTDFYRTWWSDFINLLCCLPYSEENSRQKFVLTLRAYYRGKEEELAILKEFETSYTPEKAIWWYTRDTFFYRQLNKALCQHNIQLMFLFGFYIKDVYQQLNEGYEQFKAAHSENPTLKLYRGQVMSLNEIETLQVRYADNYNTTNCLLSTSMDRSISLGLLKDSKKLEGLEKVFFEINIDTRIRSIPYGDVAKLSAFPTEAEILFMMGAEFDMTKGNVNYDEYDKCWIIKCSLAYRTSMADYEALIKGSKRSVLKNSLNKFFQAYVQYIAADAFDTVLNELIALFPSESEWIQAEKQQFIGEHYHLFKDKYGSTSALTHYEKAMRIWLQVLIDNELTEAFEIGSIYKKIGDICRCQLKDKSAADEYYDFAMHYLKLALENDAKSLTEYDQKNTLSSLVDIYQAKVGISANENEKVENILAIIKLTEQLILVQENIDHIDNYWYYQSLGDLYYQLSRYDDLYVTYEKVLETRLKNPSTRRKYLGIIDDCEKLVSICLQYKNDYQLALKNQLMKHKYIMKYTIPEPGDDEHVLSRKKSKLAESHDELADTYTLLAQYDLAKENFNLALKLHEEMLTEYQEAHSSNGKDEYEKDSIEKLIQRRRVTIETTEQKLDDVKNRKQDETGRNYVTMF